MVTFVFITFSFVVSIEQPCYAMGTYSMTCDGLVYLAQWVSSVVAPGTA